jgi:nucleoside-diphosphate-sugar epimerase
MILLSGAGGFIGRTLRKRLVASGHHVLALTHGESFVSGVGEISLDLGDPKHHERLMDSGSRCSTLIHLAGRISIQLAPATDEDVRPRAVAEELASLYQDNLIMTVRLIEFAQKTDIRHVLFASSQTVYGLPKTSLVAEDALLAPLEHYAASKVACETALALWARGCRRRVTVLRFPGVWGEERHSGIVYSLCEQAINSGRVRVGANYPLPLDVLHRDDVISAFEAALNRTGENWRVYNVATGELCSVTRLGSEVTELVPGCVLETFGVPQPDMAMDAARAAAELGWRARPRRERLARFVAQLRQEAGHA